MITYWICHKSCDNLECSYVVMRKFVCTVPQELINSLDDKNPVCPVYYEESVVNFI